MASQDANRFEGVTILLIEDDAMILDTTSAMLGRLGCQVLQAQSGSEALEIAKTHHVKIDLSIMDIVLPDMDGVKLYPLLKEIRPDHKVIVCSGYNIDGPAQEIMDAGADGFLQKPFNMKNLSSALGETLA